MEPDHLHEEVMDTGPPYCLSNEISWSMSILMYCNRANLDAYAAIEFQAPVALAHLGRDPGC